MTDTLFMAVSVSLLAMAVFAVAFTSAKCMGHSTIESAFCALIESVIVSFFALPITYIICRLAS